MNIKLYKITKIIKPKFKHINKNKQASTIAYQKR